MTDAVGKRIRRLREKQGLTLRALATKAGVPTSSINAVEQGTRAGARLSLETGKKLALAFGVTLDYLSGMHEELGQADEDAPAPESQARPTSAPAAATPPRPGRKVAQPARATARRATRTAAPVS